MANLVKSAGGNLVKAAGGHLVKYAPGLTSCVVSWTGYYSLSGLADQVCGSGDIWGPQQLDQTSDTHYAGSVTPSRVYLDLIATVWNMIVTDSVMMVILRFQKSGGGSPIGTYTLTQSKAVDEYIYRGGYKKVTSNTISSTAVISAS